MTIRNAIYDGVKQGVRTLSIALIVLHLLPVGAAALAAVAQPLNEIHVITKDHLYLSDIFNNVPKEKDQAIGPSPLPGSDIVLNARALAKLALAYNLNWAPATGDDQITLHRDAVIISADDIRAAFVDQLTKSGESGKFELAFTAPPAPIALAVGSSPEIKITNFVYDPTGLTFHGLVAAAAQPDKHTMVAGMVERIINVPVARNGLQKGAVISASDLDVMAVKETQVKGTAVLSSDSLVGLSARRNILPNRIIAAGDVEEAISMKRGDKITLIYKNETMELVAQGRVMENGRMGDRVKVVNVDSNKNLQGTVTADHEVTID